jgi:mono/diheme cytochrome c family protein
MRNFVLGILVTIAVLLIGGLGLALLGFFPTRADRVPPEMERRLAMSAFDASIERHAPRLNNPVPPTDENLISGMKIYVMACAECHGGLDRKPVSFGESLYPPAPNLISDPPDDPEWRVFYAVRTGIRNTGMPAWGKALSESDMWKVTGFLARMNKLPPAVQDYWRKSTGESAPASEPEARHEPK